MEFCELNPKKEDFFFFKDPKVSCLINQTAY